MIGSKVTKNTVATSFRHHLVPLALVVRLVSLSTTPSLAVAATIPESQQVRVAVASTVEDLSPTSVTSFLNETNLVRENNGLKQLIENSDLTRAAQRKVTDMQQFGYWDHFRPTDKKAPWDFIREAGYRYSVAGENLARGFETAHGITAAWMASPSHRANLLSAKYTDVGFATGYVTGSNGEDVLVTVQMFGAR